MTRASGSVAEVEFRVWDVARCRALLTKSYRGGASDMPRIARRIADDVVEAFTGKRGVASTEIAFVSTRTGHPEITVMDALGGNQRSATKNKSINAFPSWSPDGNAIVYMSYVFRRSPHLFRLVRGGSEKAGRLLENLDVNRAVYRGVYGPSGARLAVVISVDGAPEIFTRRRRRQEPEAPHQPQGDRPLADLVARRRADRVRLGSHRLAAALRDERRRQRPA